MLRVLFHPVVSVDLQPSYQFVISRVFDKYRCSGSHGHPRIWTPHRYLDTPDFRYGKLENIFL